MEWPATARRGRRRAKAKRRGLGPEVKWLKETAVPVICVSVLMYVPVTG